MTGLKHIPQSNRRKKNIQTLFFKINDSRVNAVRITEIPVKTTCFYRLFGQTDCFLSICLNNATP